jgi:hypothetical protein
MRPSVFWVLWALAFCLLAGCAPERIVEPVPNLSRDLDDVGARILAGRVAEARWHGWKREPASLGVVAVGGGR